MSTHEPNMEAYQVQLHPQAAGDAAVMRDVAAGDDEALKILYGRYAKLVFHVAVQSLEPAAAEEIVQDVFLTVWRKAATFDPARGSFRGWIMQIAHMQIINEHRRQRRRPQAVDDPDGEQLVNLPDGAPDPVEATWRDYCRAAVRAAMETLPPAQRQALGLAFFEDLTHEQVASVLHLPLGTVKTRIRAGMQKLRLQLAPLIVAVLLALLGLAGVRSVQHQTALRRNERAVRLLAASDVVATRLTPANDMPPTAHATYRTRPGATMAVVTLSSVPPAPAGRVYQVWAREGSTWISLGTVQPDASGAGLLIAEGPRLATRPSALEVTLEPAGGSRAPRGRPVLAWPAP